MAGVLVKKRLKYIWRLRYTNKAHSADDPLAQLVEQLTLNQWVEGSSPSGITMKQKEAA